MKRNQTNVIGKSLLKSVVIATVLMGLTMTSMSAFAKSFTGLKEPGDTVKMIAGVPLLPQDISPLLSGENIPQVKLLDAAGQSFDLNAAVLSKPTILVFYRGGWCPFCSKQLASLQEIQQDLTKWATSF